MSKIYEKSESVIAWLGDGCSSEYARACYEDAKRFIELRSVEDLGIVL